ncbi:MAG: proprotein convertase P-domain-containing protein [Caldilineaceae bacterium]
MKLKSFTNASYQNVFAFLLVAALIAAFASGPILAGVKAVKAANAVAVYWNFDSVPSDDDVSTGTLIPVSGNGTIGVIGTANGNFLSGATFDPDDSSYEAKKFPSQSTANLSTGIEFTLSTVGYKNIVLEFQRRHSSNAPNRLAIQYSINGGNLITHTFVTANNGQENTFIPTTIDLSSVTALNEKANVKFRIVGAFAEGTTQYEPTRSASPYSPLSSSIRFDELYVRGDAAAAATSTPTKTLTPTPTNTLTPTPTNSPTASPTARATTVAGGACTDYPASGLSQAVPDTTFDELSGIYTFGILISTINVPTNFTISNVDILNFSLSHQYMNDLKVELLSPQGIPTLLFSTIGNASSQGFVGTTFDDQAATSISSGQPPFSGSYRPTGPLYVYNGLTSAGQWRLRVTDKQIVHTGTLNSWTLRICTQATPTPTNTPTATSIPTNTPIGGATATSTPFGTPAATDTPTGPTPTATPEETFDPTKGTIRIAVDAQPDYGQDFTFTSFVGNFVLDDANPDDGDAVTANKTLQVAPGGPYEFIAGMPAEWTLNQVTCVGSGEWEQVLPSKSVKVTIDAGDLMTCTFVIAYTSPNTPTSTPMGTGNSPTPTSVIPGSTPTNTPGGPTNTPTKTPVGPNSTPTNTPGGTNGTPTNTPAGPTKTATITPTPTNDPTKGRINVVVDAQPDSGQNFNFFVVAGDFMLDNAVPDDGDGIGNTKTFQLTPGSYQFTANGPTEWTLTKIECVGTGSSTPNLSSKTLSVTLAAGNVLTCTFSMAYTSASTPTWTPVPPTATATSTPIGGGPTATPLGGATATPTPPSGGTPTPDGTPQSTPTDGPREFDGRVFLPVISR